MCTSPDGTPSFSLSIPAELAGLPRQCPCGRDATGWWSAPGRAASFCCEKCGPFGLHTSGLALPYGLTFCSLPQFTVTVTSGHLGMPLNGCACGSGVTTICTVHQRVMPVNVSTSAPHFWQT